MPAAFAPTETPSSPPGLRTSAAWSLGARSPGATRAFGATLVAVLVGSGSFAVLVQGSDASPHPTRSRPLSQPPAAATGVAPFAAASLKGVPSVPVSMGVDGEQAPASEPRPKGDPSKTEEFTIPFNEVPYRHDGEDKPVILGWDPALGPMKLTNPPFRRLVSRALWQPLGGVAEVTVVRYPGYALEFQLPTSAHWSDGSPLTADDYVRGLHQSLRDFEQAPDLYASQKAFAFARRITLEKIGVDRLRVRATRGLRLDPSFFRAAPFVPAPSASLQARGVTSGPYRIVSADEREVVLLPTVARGLRTPTVIVRRAPEADRAPPYGFDLLWTKRWTDPAKTEGHLLHKVVVGLCVGPFARKRLVSALEDFELPTVSQATLRGEREYLSGGNERRFDEPAGTLPVGYTRPALRPLAEALAKHLREQGTRAGPVRPVETRWAPGLILSSGVDTGKRTFGGDPDRYVLGSLPTTVVSAQGQSTPFADDPNGCLQFPPVVFPHSLTPEIERLNLLLGGARASDLRKAREALDPEPADEVSGLRAAYRRAVERYALDWDRVRFVITNGANEDLAHQALSVLESGIGTQQREADAIAALWGAECAEARALRFWVREARWRVEVSRKISWR
jgi:hypothetical protein